MSSTWISSWDASWDAALIECTLNSTWEEIGLTLESTTPDAELEACLSRERQRLMQRSRAK